LKNLNNKIKNILPELNKIYQNYEKLKFKFYLTEDKETYISLFTILFFAITAIITVISYTISKILAISIPILSIFLFIYFINKINKDYILQLEFLKEYKTKLKKILNEDEFDFIFSYNKDKEIYDLRYYNEVVLKKLLNDDTYILKEKIKSKIEKLKYQIQKYKNILEKLKDNNLKKELKEINLFN